MCLISLILSSSSETIVLARPRKVLTTDVLCLRWWFESQLRYWSVWVAFYTYSVLGNHTCIEEGYLVILFRLNGEFNVLISAVNMLSELTNSICKKHKKLLSRYHES